MGIWIDTDTLQNSLMLHSVLHAPYGTAILLPWICPYTRVQGRIFILAMFVKITKNEYIVGYDKVMKSNEL